MKILRNEKDLTPFIAHTYILLKNFKLQIMSQWTHVNASIRFDGIEMLENIISEKELGIIEKYNNGKTTDFIPCGSEGSLEYKIIKTGTENSLACRAVIITGDLRDYDNADEIIKYFERITKGKIIRSGILEIDIDGQIPLIYRYSGDKWIRITKDLI